MTGSSYVLFRGSVCIAGLVHCLVLSYNIIAVALSVSIGGSARREGGGGGEGIGGGLTAQDKMKLVSRYGDLSNDEDDDIYPQTLLLTVKPLIRDILNNTSVKGLFQCTII